MSDLVLLIGPDDFETESVTRHVRARGLELVHLRPRDPITATLVENGAVRWELHGRTLLVDRDGFVRGEGLSTVRAFFVRSLQFPVPYPAASEQWTAENIFRAGFYDGEALSMRISLLTMLEDAGSTPFNSVRHESIEWKAHRMLLLHQHGYPVPPSTITSSLTAALAFSKAWPLIIAKPLQRSIQVHVVTTEQLAQAGEAGMARSPVVLQKLERGDNVRAFVVGGRLAFLVRIVAENPVDFRGSETGYEAMTPSPALRERLEGAARLCKVAFTAIDLRYVSDDELVILELNNCPSFVTVDGRFDGVVGKALSAALCA